MSDQQPKPGDVVQLKSGGQVMTIDSLTDSQTAWCVWFEGSKPLSGSFKLVVLQKAV
jgi:uncharacterized protein YodC (DUF2158 family)